MFRTFHTSVAPLISTKYSKNLRVIFRQQIQPWHPSSTLTHEAGAAILRLAPAKFWDFSMALFEKQTEYFDVNVVHDGRNQTYARLAKLARESVGVDEGEMMALLRVSDKPAEDGSLNVGNKVTDDMKGMVKAARVVGVHVSPTVFFDGIEERGISSSFSKEQWEEWLEKNVT
jgi:protein-disulfide isomerase